MKQTDRKRVWIKGLAMECPHGTPASECPLNAVRHLTIPEANRILNGLKDQQISDYLQTHRMCFNHRKSAEAV